MVVLTMKKRITITVTLLIVCLVGIGIRFNYLFKPLRTVEVEANYVLYDSEEQLHNFADVIAIGNASSELKDDKVVTKKNEMGRLDDFYTITPFNIQKLIKGEIQDKTININQPAAIIKDTDRSDIKVKLQGYSELKKNSKYVLYLKKSSDGSYSIISVTQGKFNLDGTDSEENEKVSKNNQVMQLKDQVLKKIK